MSQLKIDKAEAFSVHTQLVEQFKFQIARGRWELGKQLPSVREVAVVLGVNYNTVRGVYQQLERDGYVVTDQGRGTFVASSLSRSEIGQYGTLLDLVDEALMQALAAGISVDMFARTAYVRARLYEITPPDIRCLFAECNQADLDYFLQSLERNLGVRPDGYLLDDLARQGPEFLEGFDVIATTLSHVAELQAIVGEGRSVLGLRIEPSYEKVLSQLSVLPAETPVGLLCATRESAEKMKRAIQGAGLSHLRPITGGVTHHEEVKAIFEATSYIYLSRHGRSLINENEWSGGRAVQDYVTEFDPAALLYLRRKIEAVDERGEGSR
ncbi:GntR family transcriptional regulator [Dictyobacter halimunensis]